MSMQTKRKFSGHPLWMTLCVHNSENVLRYEIYIPYSQNYNSFAACMLDHVLIFDNPFGKFCLPIIQRPPIETYVMR